MDERWQPVPGFGGHYEASDYGHVRSKARVVRKRNRWGQDIEQHYQQRVLSEYADREGYLKVRFGVDGSKYNSGVHRLVAMAFHGLPKSDQECCHINGNPADNRPENLRWDTHLENNRDRHRHGNYAVGSAHHQSKLDPLLIGGIVLGLASWDAALSHGVSKTHYHRLKRRDPEWFTATYGIDLLERAREIWESGI